MTSCSDLPAVVVELLYTVIFSDCVVKLSAMFICMKVNSFLNKLVKSLKENKNKEMLYNFGMCL